MNHHTTIIIGAGISGIKAANDLTQNGIDTLILEARDRLGGRLHTIKTESGIPLDIGASWFHDCLVNPLLRKAVDTGNVQFYYDDGRFDIFTKQHGLVNDNMKFKPVADEIKDYLKQICSEQFTSDNDISVRQACYNYFKLKGYTLTEDQIRYAPQLIRYFEMWIGSSWDSLSARLISSDEHWGRNALVTNGYMTFYYDELDELASGFGTGKGTGRGTGKGTDLIGSRILLNKVVYRIRFDQKTRYIMVSARDQTTNEETTYSCDYLLCSVPLSVLKLSSSEATGSIRWEPPLPQSLVEKLGKVSFSGLGKVFLEFKDCFWPQETDRFLCLADPDDELTLSITENRPITFSSSGRITDDPDPFKYTVLFMNLYRAAKVPVLLALISEPLTNFIESSDDETIWRFFRPLVANISKPVESEPVSIHHTNWTNDPFSRGSYTGVTVGDDLMPCIEALQEAKGIFDGKGRVRFMGEGVIDEGNGCVHGAWLTGQREAGKVVGMINRGRL
ncbi:hypothetical protein FOA43_002928 [Brettanomyces nanus]|uniref:Amine oxidase domain-containing protein n=1 Tax=Eeniella nana TaxID=13502 RepID=A0A875S6E8_EENNA|nr:uncharacterized protein FOA43_002928 [Brettanomyces nanus]QPG75572.1 hypothetical protein FOA43_002928 [Brettanomyces nanus]